MSPLWIYLLVIFGSRLLATPALAWGYLHRVNPAPSALPGIVPRHGKAGQRDEISGDRLPRLSVASGGIHAWSFSSIYCFMQYRFVKKSNKIKRLSYCLAIVWMDWRTVRREPATLLLYAETWLTSGRQCLPARCRHGGNRIDRNAGDQPARPGHFMLID
ncbi:hypothetical protein ABWL39_03365 [Chitinivorax sp. PXF-14]|uniref:hypothetical protein n=1 Tax=Chitinivorax sp. PXF-14 TaxID=3230488 RepID=UPI0034662B0F